jgi:hypothetical protein
MTIQYRCGKCGIVVDTTDDADLAAVECPVTTLSECGMSEGRRLRHFGMKADTGYLGLMDFKNKRDDGPDFKSQLNAAMSDDERREWFRKRSEEAAGNGATWHRFTVTKDGLITLYEGWKVRPADEGEPRFTV